MIAFSNRGFTSVSVLEGLNLPVEGGDHGGVLLLQPADAALQPRDPLLGAARAAIARHGGGRPLPRLGLAMMIRVIHSVTVPSLYLASVPGLLVATAQVVLVAGPSLLQLEHSPRVMRRWREALPHSF